MCCMAQIQTSQIRNLMIQGAIVRRAVVIPALPRHLTTKAQRVVNRLHPVAPQLPVSALYGLGYSDYIQNHIA